MKLRLLVLAVINVVSGLSVADERMVDEATFLTIQGEVDLRVSYTGGYPWEDDFDAAPKTLSSSVLTATSFGYAHDSDQNGISVNNGNAYAGHVTEFRMGLAWNGWIDARYASTQSNRTYVAGDFASYGLENGRMQGDFTFTSGVADLQISFQVPDRTAADDYSYACEMEADVDIGDKSELHEISFLFAADNHFHFANGVPAEVVNNAVVVDRVVTVDTPVSELGTIEVRQTDKIDVQQSSADGQKNGGTWETKILLMPRR